MEDIRKIFNERGELCDTIIDIFKEKGNEKFIPKFDKDCGYYMDWDIIGDKYKKYFCWTQLSNNMFCIEYPDDVDWHIWNNEIRPKTQQWVSWLSKNLFHPKNMIVSTFTTDRVRMRIAVALLDKMELPRQYADEFFDNYVVYYWARKHVYNTFYYKHILKIPF